MWFYTLQELKIQFRKHEVKSNDFNYNETDVVRTLLESDKND